MTVTQDNLADAWEQGVYDLTNYYGFNEQDMAYPVETVYENVELSDAYCEGASDANYWMLVGPVVAPLKNPYVSD